MKKYEYLLLAIPLTLALTSCSNNDSTSTNAAATTDTSISSAPAIPETPSIEITTEPEPVMEETSIELYFASLNQILSTYVDQNLIVLETSNEFMTDLNNNDARVACYQSLIVAADIFYSLRDLNCPEELEPYHTTLTTHCSNVADDYMSLSDIYSSQVDLTQEETASEIMSVQTSMMSHLGEMETAMFALYEALQIKLEESSLSE